MLVTYSLPCMSQVVKRFSKESQKEKGEDSPPRPPQSIPCPHLWLRCSPASLTSVPAAILFGSPTDSVEQASWTEQGSNLPNVCVTSRPMRLSPYSVVSLEPLCMPLALYATVSPSN